MANIFVKSIRRKSVMSVCVCVGYVSVPVCVCLIRGNIGFEITAHSLHSRHSRPFTVLRWFGWGVRGGLLAVVANLLNALYRIVVLHYVHREFVQHECQIN